MGKFRVILAGGASGGHLYPGLAIAGRLRERGDAEDILFLGIRRGVEASVVPSHGYRVEFTSAMGFGGSVLKKLYAAIVTLWGTAAAWSIVRKWKPSLVIGLGGYASVPGVLAARLSGVPIILLEQNQVPGMATRFLSRFSKVVCISFPGTEKHLTGIKTAYTGNPVREKIISADRKESRRKLGIDEGKFCLLVTGASQGARSINDAVLAALLKWKSRPWTIIHLTGKKDYPEVKKNSEGLLPKESILDYRPEPYMEDIQEAYAAADLALSRAGATSLAEITVRGLPAILVPYPFAGAHQMENARYLESLGGAVILPESELNNSVVRVIEEISSDPQRLKDMRENSLKGGKPDALELIMTEVDKFIDTGERRI